MKDKIHPNYHAVKVVCSCGNSFEAWSTVDKDVLQVEICSECHPFYTGKQKIVDTAGRVERFQKRYAAKPVQVKPEPAAEAKKPAKKAATKAAAAKKPAVKKAATKAAK